jgi:hypothetical protein
LLTLGAGNGDWVGLKVLEVLKDRAAERGLTTGAI